MLKLIHTADWHLGKILYGRSLIEDQRYLLYHWFLPLLDEEKPDGVLLTGDVFDRPIAPVESLRLFDEILVEIGLKRGIRFFVSAGNHDGADRMAVGGPLLAGSGLHFATRLQIPIQPVRLEKNGEAADLWQLPYFDPAMARDALGREDIRGTSESYRAVLDSFRDRLDPAVPQILTAHCFVLGSEPHGEDSGTTVGTLGEVDSGTFEGFDYVALGHLHGAQKAGENARYSGSLLPYSFDDCHTQKSVTVLEIENRNITVRLIPTQPLRRMRVLTGPFQQLCDEAKTDAGRDDYIYAVLTGTPVFEPFARLREFYPNLLGLRNGVSEQAALDPERERLRDQLRRTRPDETMLFREFFRQMCSEEVTPEDLAEFKRLSKENDPS